MRGSDHGKHEKTRKTLEKSSRKLLKRNTFEQYAGLKFSAASTFFEKTFSISRKSQNRLFPENEQYAGLESEQARIRSVQAARSRGSGRLGAVRIQGYQGSLGWSKAAN